MTCDNLKADRARFDVLEIKDGVQLYINPAQTMNKIESLISGLKNDDSLGSFWEGAVADSKLEAVPVYILDLKDSSSKLFSRNSRTRQQYKKVSVYYIISSENEINNKMITLL